MLDSPQVFLIGKISGAQHFDSDQLYCKFFFKCGDHWQLISGKDEGETFQSKSVHGKYVPFEHPFDLNYSTKSVRGWPKLLVEVWEVDDEDRNLLGGYGIQTLPIEMGEYKLDIVCWRPEASYFDKMIGAYPELLYRDVLLCSDSRIGFKTSTTGVVIVEVAVVTKDFQLHGVQTSNKITSENVEQIQF